MPDQAPATILYVDDDPGNRQALSWIFQSEGFNVWQAATGQEALELAERGPDLVVLDVNLPDINGFEVCRRIKAHPAAGRIPVLHLSACYVNSADRVRGLEGGADGYLTKPVDMEEVLAHARALLRVHQAEERERAAARDWQATFDAMNDGVCLLDRDGRARRCNRALTELLGLPAAEVLGRDVHELVAGPARAGEPAPFRRMFQSRRREGLELTRGGRVLHITTDPIVDPAGALTGAVYVVADVTAHHRLEEQYRQAQKMEAVGRLAGGIAHDFNNLLTIIMGCGEVLLAGPDLVDESRELVGQVLRSCERAASLTRQLLTFSRRQALRPRVLDLNLAVRDTARLLRRLIGADVELVVDLDAALGPVRADPDQVAQVLLNLAVNARDAMPHGGRLTIQTDTATVEREPAEGELGMSPGRYAVLSVRDTGCGMTPEVQSRLFEPFFTTKEVGKGTGLGLATVYGIVRQSQGHITVDSSPGAGTTFHIYLPLAEGSPAAPAPPSESRPVSRGRETVLLIEDEEPVRRLARMGLELVGYTVLEAGDAAEALAAFEQVAGKVDLVLADVVLPGAGGPEVVERLKAIRPDLKVVFMSGYAEDATPVHGVVTAGRPFLRKPFSPAALAEMVRAVLDRADAVSC